MATDLQVLSAHFATVGPAFTTSPLYRELCSVVANEPTILQLLSVRRAGQQPSFLLFGAVQYLLLDGLDHPLRRFYPSLADHSVADIQGVGPVFSDFCHDHHQALTALLETKLVQTNVVNRAVALRLGLWEVGRRSRQPVHLIDVGTSAGTHLRFDRYRYVIGEHIFGDPRSPVTLETEWRAASPPPDLDDLPPIASRTGVDLNPIDVTDEKERLWLRALVWPEDQHKAETLGRALEIVARHPPEVLAGSIIQTAPALAERLPPGEPRVVFHAAVRMHVPPDDVAAFDQTIDSLGIDGPLYHLWVEPPSAPHHGYPADPRGTLQLHGPHNNEPASIAKIDGHLAWIAPLND